MPYTFKVNEGKKIITLDFEGNPTVEELDLLKKDFEQNIIKVKTDEWKVLITSQKTKVMAPEAVQIMKDIQETCLAKYKKVATVVESVLLETQVKKSGSEILTNRRLFKANEEAMKWLME